MTDNIMLHPGRAYRAPTRSLIHRIRQAFTGTIVIASGTIAIACSSLAFAQQIEQPTNWYQVEVIIFERLAHNRAEDPEAWPKDISLGYPANWRKLIEPETAADWLAEIEDGGDPLGTQTSQVNGNPTATTAETGADQTARDATQPVLANNETQTEPDAGLANTPQPMPRPPLLQRDDQSEYAFVRLESDQRTLNESAGAISRDRGMRVLFHEAWRQPLNTDAEAPAIIVQGGNEYGEHSELEGALHLSISRYLHLQSNLWLTQFIPNYGQETEHWPALPSVPTRQRPDTQANDDESDLMAGETQSAWDITPELPEDYTSLIDQPFLVKEIVTLNQTRRMRSGELHYIDHPRIGLLIKVDTYRPDADEDERTRR